MYMYINVKFTMFKQLMAYLSIVEGFDFEQCIGPPSFILGARLSNHKTLSTKANHSLQFIINVLFSSAFFLFAINCLVWTANKE